MLGVRSRTKESQGRLIQSTKDLVRARHDSPTRLAVAIGREFVLKHANIAESAAISLGPASLIW
jgi:hypothetical protein